MHLIEEERIIDRLTKAYEDANDPEFKKLWDHKLREFKKRD
tara:strand:- start:346 stop:468 length:123 start_codon:yes stop_codon:yes gene_type:complete